MFKAILLSCMLTFGLAPAAQAKEEIVGVGMVLMQTLEGIVLVESVVKNSPADLSGMVRDGDELMEVQSLPTSPWVIATGKDMDLIVGMIRGEEGSLVGLKLQPADGAYPRSITLKREKIVVED